ncbi:MAG: hypothetical protein CL908_17755, partial [Deltaproteobacteria bacterium]|nr:hypothetical protein [Deltaproteobacteria bacterium]
MSKTAIGILSALLLVTAAPLVAQPGGDGAHSNDKEIQRILREQETAIRRVKELRRRVARLQARMEKEGRGRSSELLKQAMKRLDEINLADQMLEVKEGIRGGQAFASLSKATEVVKEIQQLLNLLLEKDNNLAEIEQKLKEFEEMSRRIGDLRDREREIKNKTDEIKNAMTPEQKAAIARELKNLRELRDEHEKNRERLRENFGDKMDRYKDVDATLEHLKQTLRELEQRARDLKAKKGQMSAAAAARRAQQLKQQSELVKQNSEALTGAQEAKMAVEGAEKRVREGRAPADSNRALSPREMDSVERAQKRARAMQTEAEEATEAAEASMRSAE